MVVSRKHLIFGVLLSSFLVSGGLAVNPSVAQDAPGELFIQVKLARLREAPKHWAAGVREVPYGSRISEVSRDGDWLKVRGPDGAEGYVHTSAVTSRTVILKGAGTAVPAQAEPTDIVLAGKGFASQLETMFRNATPGLDYEAVDRLEQKPLDGVAFEEFLRAGKLKVEAIEGGPRG